MKSKSLVQTSLALACGAVAGSILILGSNVGCEVESGGAGSAFVDVLSTGRIGMPEIIHAIEKEQDRQKKKILSSQVAEQQVAELVQRAGGDLAAKLPQIGGVKDSDKQKILAISSIKKADGANGDVEGALASLRTLLINNQAVAASFVVVDRSSTGAEEIMRTVSGAAENSPELAGFDDPLQRRSLTTKKVVYHPDDIYVLSGTLFIHDNANEVKDNPEKRVITYQLTTSVNHARSGQIRLQREFKQSFTWDKQAKKFVPAA